MSLKLSALLLFLVLVFDAYSQVDNSATLMSIAGKPVTVGEFMSIYQKNNVRGEAIDKKSMDDYLDLFINFKLKVLQAEQLGLDTVSSFIKELDGYRDQLAKPFFTDEATLNSLIQEAYERKKLDLRASHIYFRVKPDATAQDTLNSFNKAMEAREKILKGERFDKVVMEYSEDPSAKDREATAQHPFMKGNKGDLGYFTVFDMVYPFETAAYNTQVGQVSKPIRTDYGFHVINVTDRIPALGDFVVAHLFLGIPKGANAADSAKVKSKIDSLYTQLKAGAKFEDLVKIYSEDKGSSSKGGVLPKRGVNRLMPEFIAAIANIPNVGDFSVPVLTPGYGWHIVKLVERKPIGTFDEEKVDLKRFFELEDGFKKLLSIVLIGQTELKTKLSERAHEVREVVQRCELIELSPLDAHLEDYLRFKFARVGSTLDAVFDKNALDAIRERLIFAKSSKNNREVVSLMYPLMINNLVTGAMNQAATFGLPKVSFNLIKEA